MKYEIKDSSQSFRTNYCTIGKFSGKQEHAIADVVIKVEGMNRSEIHINRKVLREVLLQNPEEVRELLGLVVREYTPKQKFVPKKTEEVEV